MKSLFFRILLSELAVTVMVVSVGAHAYAETAQLCDAKTEKINKVKTVKKEAKIRLAPSDSAKKLVNPKATEAMHSTQYAQIDSSTKVREVCKKNGWSYIELTEPEWLISSHKGWVPSNALNEIKVSGSGKRIYRENEVGWDKYTKPYKKQVLYAINNFLQDDCKEGFDTFSVTESPSKSTKKAPVFFIACGHPPNARNIFFSKADIEKRMKK
jgi:hypothetical protein